MFDELQHPGGVRSRINKTCLVQDPVTVIVEGKETELSLEDAKLLLSGLQEAVARVESSVTALMGNGLNYNVAIIAKSGSGMSFPRSRLG